MLGWRLQRLLLLFLDMPSNLAISAVVLCFTEAGVAEMSSYVMFFCPFSISCHAFVVVPAPLVIFVSYSHLLFSFMTMAIVNPIKFPSK